MANDSVVSSTFETHIEYDTGRKFMSVAGAGLVTTWGNRVGNTIFSALAKQPNLRDVDDLSSAVVGFLRNEYQPHTMGEHVGYHVGGFTASGQARLYHHYWNPTLAEGQPEKGYGSELHEPKLGHTIFLYNGRDELANTVVGAFINQLNSGRPVRFPRSAPGYCQLAQFIVRFASEISPEVGPPILTHVLNPNNEVKTITSSELSPLSESDAKAACASLRIPVEERAA
jgi:hypothetical protein